MERLIISSSEVVTSTSDLVLVAARDNAPEGTAQTANIQTKGRGRNGRDWQSPKGNFYLSVLLRPSRDQRDWPSLSLMAGLALYHAVAMFRPKSDLGLKWPNDLLYQGGKTAGLLLEAEKGAVVLGCGVNLDAPPESVSGWAPSALNQDDIAPVITPALLLPAVEEHLIQFYQTWTDHGFLGLRDDWLTAAAHLNGRLTIDHADGSRLEGVFTTLGDDGRLCLQDDNGVDHHLTAGEVVRARLAEAP